MSICVLRTSCRADASFCPPAGINPLRVAGIGCLINGHRSRENLTRMVLPTPALHTARLRLRPFGDADADDLFALHSNA
jgi:[ribosomal protein S5]-alanine N-acetyltransferase